VVPPLLTIVETTLNHVHAIGGAMDRLYHGGEAEACEPLLVDFYGVVDAPTLDVTGEPAWMIDAYLMYREAVDIIVEKVGVIRDTCEAGGGSVGDLAFDVARMGVNDAGSRLEGALQLLR
jgi:hypothetical protein